MNHYEVIAHTMRGIYAETVKAENFKQAIRKAKPKLRDMADGYDITRIRVVLDD